MSLGLGVLLKKERLPTSSNRRRLLERLWVTPPHGYVPLTQERGHKPSNGRYRGRDIGPSGSLPLPIYPALVSRHTGSARCRLFPGRWQCDGRFWGESPRPSATCLFGLFISVSTQPRVGFLLASCSLETAVRHHGSIKRAPKNTAGKLQPEPRRLKDLGHGPTRGRYDSRQYSQSTFRLPMSPSSTREEVYKTILTIPAAEWRSRR